MGLRVGVEVRATAGVVTATLATPPWMTPERISLDSRRWLILVATNIGDPVEACSYAERRVRKAADGLGLDVAVLGSEAFPAVIDLRNPQPDPIDDPRT